MKRMLLVFTAMLAAISISFPAQALAEEGSVLIRVETVDTAADGTVDVPVLLGDCAGVDSVQFDVNYDSAALSIVSVTPGDLFPAEYTVSNIDEPGRVRIACASALGLGDSGTLLTLRFRVLSDAGSAITITSGIVTRVDAAYVQSEAYVSIEDGGVSVGGAALPASIATPWIPATPIPSPTPTPSPTPSATPEPTASPAATATQTLSPLQSIPLKAIIAAGALLLLAIVLIFSLVAAKRKKRGQENRPRQ